MTEEETHFLTICTHRFIWKMSHSTDRRHWKNHWNAVHRNTDWVLTNDLQFLTDSDMWVLKGCSSNTRRDNHAPHRNGSPIGFLTYMAAITELNRPYRALYSFSQLSYVLTLDLPINVEGVCSVCGTL